MDSDGLGCRVQICILEKEPLASASSRMSGMEVLFLLSEVIDRLSDKLHRRYIIRCMIGVNK